MHVDHAALAAPHPHSSAEATGTWHWVLRNPKFPTSPFDGFYFETNDNRQRGGVRINVIFMDMDHMPKL